MSFKISVNMSVNEIIGWIPTNTYNVGRKIGKRILESCKRKVHYKKFDSTLKE